MVLAASLALTSLTFAIASAEPYRVMSGDTLRVDVFLSPEHSSEIKVDDAGQITLPAIGRLQVNGLTAEDIESEVREKLTSLSEISGVAYNERAIKVVDFSSLTSAQKHTALVAANNARCTCGCGMGLAQCVATDSTCPIREPNIEKIRTMVRDAAR